MKTAETFNLLIHEEDVVQGSTPPVEVASNYTPAGVIKQTGGVTQTPDIDIVGETYTDGGIRYIPTTEEPLTNIKDLPENGDVKYPNPTELIQTDKFQNFYGGGGNSVETPTKPIIEEGSNLIKNNKKTAIIIAVVIALIVLGSFLSK